MKLNKIETAEENASFFYSLNNEDSNHWYFLLEVGKDNKGLRLSCEQEILIADEIYKRLTVHDELVEALQVCDDWLDMTDHQQSVVSKALSKARGES